jgi:hypothetical protein
MGFDGALKTRLETAEEIANNGKKSFKAIAKQLIPKNINPAHSDRGSALDDILSKQSSGSITALRNSVRGNSRRGSDMLIEVTLPVQAGRNGSAIPEENTHYTSNGMAIRVFSEDNFDSKPNDAAYTSPTPMDARSTGTLNIIAPEKNTEFRLGTPAGFSSLVPKRSAGNPFLKKLAGNSYVKVAEKDGLHKKMKTDHKSLKAFKLKEHVQKQINLIDLNNQDISVLFQKYNIERKPFLKSTPANVGLDTLGGLSGFINGIWSEKATRIGGDSRK